MRPMLLAVITAVSLPVAVRAQRAQQAQQAQHGARLTQNRVLAEAASSSRDTGQFFLVAARARPFTVIGAYETREAADSAARAAGAAYRRFGPYRGPGRDPWEVLSITVRVRTDSGERELHYDPRSVDALFLSMSAVRKFMLPYYRRLYGPAVADSVQTRILVPRPPTPPCHRLSFPCVADSLLGLPSRMH